MKNQKTIFITCFFGLVARDILDTDVLGILKSQENLRIVILGPDNKKPLYEKQFASDNVIIEGVPSISMNLKETITFAIFRDLLSSRTRRIQRLVKYNTTNNYFDYLLGGFLAFWGRFRWVVKAARLVFRPLKPSKIFDEYFRKYDPDLLFSTDIMVRDDIRFMRAARRRKVPIVGMVRSWDNLTIYGILQVIPDKIIVQNEPIKNELLSFQALPDKNIFVVGVPHYDHYVKKRRTPKEKFFKKLGLDPALKTVFMTATGQKHLIDQETNFKIIEILASLGVNVLVRLPVMGDIDFGDFVPSSNVVLDKPVRTKESVDAQLNRQANQHLADSLFWSDVIVTGPSTIITDAVVFNKPVVYTDFDYNPTPYWQSARRFHDYNHIGTILKSGGVKRAQSLAQLEKFVQQYLDNPRLDETQRKALALQKRFKLDGKSSERLTDVVLKELNK